MERLLTAYQEDLLSLDELRRRMPDLRAREQSMLAELQAILAFLAVLLHDVQDHVAEHGEIFGTVSQTAPVLILVHDDVEPPVQAMVSRPEGFRLRPLSERCGSLSTHTAPIKQTRPRFLAASARTDAAASRLCVRGAGFLP